MLKQEYNAQALLSVVEKEDVRRWRLWDKPSEKIANAQQLAKALHQSDYRFNHFQLSQRKGKLIIYPIQPQDYLALKLVDRYLRRIYKVEQADRAKIIRQIRCILMDGGKLSLIKSDISSFYESVSFETIIAKIKEDMIFDNNGIKLLESLKEETKSRLHHNGIPRGIGVSSTLAELYLRELDNALKQHQDIIYYARYVDDLFIVVDSDNKNKMKEILVEKLKKLGLKSSPNKQGCYDLSGDCEFNYLGYQFEVKINKKQTNNLVELPQNRTELKQKIDDLFAHHNSSGEYSLLTTDLKKLLISRDNKKQCEITLKIAPQKVNRIKQRIAKSFADYKKTGDFQLLLNRLRYLSCSKAIKKTENGSLMAGNAYNYRYVTDNSVFKVFDGFINRAMLSKYSFTTSQEDKIKKISFYQAVLKQTKASFTQRQIANIKRVWLYD